MTSADVDVSAAVCGWYEVGTVWLYPSRPLCHWASFSSVLQQKFNPGKQSGLADSAHCTGGQELGWVADPLVEPRWVVSRCWAGAVGTATSAGGAPGECKCPFGNVSSAREALCLKFSCLSHFQLNWTNIIDLYWQYNLSRMLLLQSCIVQLHLRKHR